MYRTGFLCSVYQQYPLKLTPFSKCKFITWQTTHLLNSLGHWIVNSCQGKKGMNLQILLNGINFNGYYCLLCRLFASRKKEKIASRGRNICFRIPGMCYFNRTTTPFLIIAWYCLLCRLFAFCYETTHVLASCIQWAYMYVYSYKIYTNCMSSLHLF